MAVGRSCICSASILSLFLFCCLSSSLCHPSTFLFGFCRVLSDGEVAMNIRSSRFRETGLVFKIARTKIHQNFLAPKYDIKQHSDAT